MSDEQTALGVEVTESPSGGEEDVLQTGVIPELETPSSEDEPQELTKSSDEYEREIQGLKSGIQAEREKRQWMEQQVRQFQQPQRQPEQPQFADDDYLTAGEVKKMLQQAIGQKEQEFRQVNIHSSISAAKDKYSDFQEVFKLADELSKEDPAMYDYVVNSRNPGEAIYRLGKTHPDYMSKVESTATKKVAEKINSNAKQPKTLSNVAGASGKQNEATRIRTMSDEDFDKLMADVELKKQLSGE